MKKPTEKQMWVDAYLGLGGSPKELEGKTKDEIVKMAKELQETANFIPDDNGEVKIVEITASVSRKMNLGNYESKDFFCSMKGEVKGDVDIQRAYRILNFKCQVAIDEQVQKELERNNKSKPF